MYWPPNRCGGARSGSRENQFGATDLYSITDYKTGKEKPVILKPSNRTISMENMGDLFSWVNLIAFKNNKGMSLIHNLVIINRIDLNDSFLSK